MSHELPSNLRLRKVGNIRKMLKLHRIIALRSIPIHPPPPPPHHPPPPPPKMKIPPALANPQKNRNRTSPAARYFTRKPKPLPNIL